jgi:hypothetical protein
MSFFCSGNIFVVQSKKLKMLEKSLGSNDSVSISVSVLPFVNNQKLVMHHYRIDTTHSNAYTV